MQRSSILVIATLVATAIVFQPLFVPEPGKVLNVTYYVTCN